MRRRGLFDTVKKPCSFCAIIRGTKDSYPVYDDETSIVFLDHAPPLKGHCILAPKEHYETFEELPGRLIRPVFRNVQLISRAVEAALEAEGSFIALNNKISQSVPHVHIHIVPRWKKDGLFSRKFVWIRRPYRDEAEALSYRKKLREAIRELSGK